MEKCLRFNFSISLFSFFTWQKWLFFISIDFIHLINVYIFLNLIRILFPPGRNARLQVKLSHCLPAGADSCMQGHDCQRVCVPHGGSAPQSCDFHPNSFSPVG